MLGITWNMCETLSLIDGLVNQGQVNRLHWHLRGFFWELVAARDSIVTAERTSAKVGDVVRQLRKANWFEEVLAYRNFAHRSFHVVEVMYPSAGGKCIIFVLQETIKGRGQETLEALDNYLREMSNAVDAAFKL